jgi:hypothetical protein
MSSANGVDTSWKDEAHCRKGSRPDDLPYFAWTVEPKDRGPLLLGRPAAAWIALALMECRNCPAQYGCARFAIEVGEQWGTWAMPIEELKWLRKHFRHDTIIDTAEQLGVPMQEAVKTAHGTNV